MRGVTTTSTAPRPTATPDPARHPWVVRAFRAVAIAEAFSWAGLLVGMYLKWVAGTTERGVEIFGPVHGGLVLVYVALAAAVAVRVRWSLWTTFLALAATVPPFCTVAFDVWAHRSGRYRSRRSASSTAG
jgi:integral membrane protein